MTTAYVRMPPKLLPLFTPPRGDLRFRGAKGGRGSGKSFTFAKMAAIFGAIEPLRILCTRELQDSIKESFHAELKNAIATEPWLENEYDIGVDYLRGRNGTEFIFKGLRHNIGSIKSMAQIDICIVEEAEDVPEASWLALEPTIRAEKSEIWCIWNPRAEGSPIDNRMVKNPPPRSMCVTLNADDNPDLPPILLEQRAHQRKVLDMETYLHIWEGAYLKRSKANIFGRRWRIDAFEPQPGWDGPYYGIDFGFSQDPTAGVTCWVSGNTLYIEREAGRVGLELDETAPFLLERMPGLAAHVSRADSARPESISYLKRHGLPRITACEKGKGSVEDGIEFIKSFNEIVVHERCTETQKEMTNYSYKIDRLTGDVLPVIVDAWNHYIDAIRYALEPIMKNPNRMTGIAIGFVK